MNPTHSSLLIPTPYLRVDDQSAYVTVNPGHEIPGEFEKSKTFLICRCSTAEVFGGRRNESSKEPPPMNGFVASGFGQGEGWYDIIHFPIYNFKGTPGVMSCFNDTYHRGIPLYQVDSYSVFAHVVILRAN